jgi:serine/threonine-protein kinase RsbW
MRAFSFGTVGDSFLPIAAESLAVSPEPESLQSIHDLLRNMLDRAGAVYGMQVEPIWIFEMETGLGEIAANIIAHAQLDAREQFRLVLDLHADRLTARFEDHGAPVTLPLNEDLPDPMGESGRGLAIARKVLDVLKYERLNQLNIWLLMRRTPDRAGGARLRRRSRSAPSGTDTRQGC